MQAMHLHTFVLFLLNVVSVPDSHAAEFTPGCSQQSAVAQHCVLTVRILRLLSSWRRVSTLLCCSLAHSLLSRCDHIARALDSMKFLSFVLHPR